MNVYKIELLVIDFDNMGGQGIKETIENQKYPNYCINPTVMSVKERDIGKWTDSHPLNHKDKMQTEYDRLFNTKDSSTL